MKISKKPLLAVFLLALSLNTYTMDADLDSLLSRDPANWKLILNSLHPLSTGIKIVNAYKDRSERTLLHRAVVDENTEAAKTLLIKYHANPNIANNYDVTPLMAACRTSDVAMVKLLLNYGANPRLTNDSGKTCLDFLNNIAPRIYPEKKSERAEITKLINEKLQSTQ